MSILVTGEGNTEGREREMRAGERDGGGERGMLKMEFDTLKQAYNYNITYHFLFTTILPLFLIIK